MVLFVSLSFLKFLDALYCLFAQIQIGKKLLFSYSLFYVPFLSILINTILADSLAESLIYPGNVWVVHEQYY